MKAYKLHLEYMEESINVGKNVRVDLPLSMTLDDVAELKGFKYEQFGGHTEKDRTVSYLKVTGRKKNPVGELKKPKRRGTAKLSFGKYEEEDFFGGVEKRSLDIGIYAKGGDIEESKVLLYEIIALMEERTDLEFNRCPAEEEDTYYDGTIVDFIYGEMTDVKKEIMSVFKTVKKELNIR